MLPWKEKMERGHGGVSIGARTEKLCVRYWKIEEKFIFLDIGT